MSLPELRDFLRDHLLNFIMPFWLKYAIDERGGINTCIQDDGQLISHDKLLWSQLRAIYTFSALYNRVERKQQYLDIAAQIVRFTARHGRDDEGRWIFRVDRDGKPVEGPISIYVDGFALQGLAEFIQVTNDSDAKKLALETYENVERRLANPSTVATFPYPLPEGIKAHGISMIFSYANHELAKATGDARVAATALKHANMIMDEYRRPQRQLLLEHLTTDGQEQMDTPIGRTVVPGHAIESMWFQIHQFRDLGHTHRIAQCLECIRWHIEKGWDPQYGGILLGMDALGKEPIYWKFPDTKLWWPVTESMYALLLAHTLGAGDWALEWYWKVHDIAFKHYPVTPHGEWTQRLDRQFRKIDTVVALPVKDPFHLPRAITLCVQLLEQATR